MLPVFLLRSLAAAFGAVPFTQPHMAYAPGPLQVAVFVCLIALGLLGSIGFILMVKERAEREVMALAMTDALTGALNRRAFMERAEKELALALRSGLPMALLMLDLDHFKRINDEYGHAVGDAVLVEAASRIRRRLRRQDSFGRYGGEEFCILLPATDADGALALAETLRNELSARPVEVGRQGVSVTVSLGVTVCTAGCAACLPDFGRILEDADRALYQAKGGGRNCTVVLPLNCRM